MGKQKAEIRDNGGRPMVRVVDSQGNVIVAASREELLKEIQQAREQQR